MKELFQIQVGVEIPGLQTHSQLQDNLRFSNNLLPLLVDHESGVPDGAVGRAFLNEFLGTGCTSYIVRNPEDWRADIAYIAFDPNSKPDEPSFVDRIYYADRPTTDEKPALSQE
jgi:hypothetical protein